MGKVIVRDNGFNSDEPEGIETVSVDELMKGVENPVVLLLQNDEDLSDLQQCFCWLRAIHISFPDFTDGRGFSLAVRLRKLGYTGTLRATGHVIADQYRLARQSGFDEVAIDELLAARQPEDHWISQARQKGMSYQLRLLKAS